MKKTILVLLAVLSFHTFAADEPLMVDGKLILITDVGTSNSDRALHSNDGIYILTSAGGPAGQDKLPNAEAIIREILVAHGIKVADKLEDANVAVVFDMGGSATMVTANNKADHSNLPGSGKVMASAGAIAAGVATGGVFAAVGYLAGALIPTDESTYLGAFIIDKPVLQERGLFTKRKLVMPSVDKGSSYSSNNVHVKYKLEKGKEAPEDAVLKMMTEQWVKHHIVADAATAPVSASGVSSAETIVEAKK